MGEITYEGSDVNDPPPLLDDYLEEASSLQPSEDSEHMHGMFPLYLSAPMDGAR